MGADAVEAAECLIPAVHRATRFAAFALLLLAGNSVRADPIPLGGRLREALLDDLNGGPHYLSSYVGRPLIINVWASWCGPCRAEVASLERLAWRDEARYFAIIGISTDDYRDRALEWLRQSNATIPHYLDHNLTLEHMLGASRLPVTLLFDAHGTLIDRIYGARDWDSAESLQRIRRDFGIGSTARR